MRILHVATELAPIVKVGGLADVLLGLSRALIEKGQSVSLLLPKYDCLDLSGIENLEVIIPDLWSTFEHTRQHNSVWRGKVQGIPVYFIETHDPYAFFERQKIYGCTDDSDRFAYFCRAAFDFLGKTETRFDILHLHEWQTAALAPLFHHLANANRPKILFTIHNLLYQGKCSPTTLEKLGLPPDQQLHDDQERSLLNLLKGGITYADLVTTVSPNYAREILTPEGSQGMLPTLLRHKEKIQGILNGIDYDFWNPEKDAWLPACYSSKEIGTKPPFIAAKDKCKEHLRRTFFLAEEESPIVSCVTRLVSQKGPELIKQALFRTLEKGGQFILLGSSPDPEIHDAFYMLKRKLAGSRHVHIELSYNEQLSHLVFAGSDLFVVPSIFEPCGLTQLIAMCYGTIPVVRWTGGLADTVVDVDDEAKRPQERNGFFFGPPTAEGVFSALDRAFAYWNQAPEKMRLLIKNGMQADFSWKKPSEEYLKLYKTLKPHETKVSAATI